VQRRDVLGPPATEPSRQEATTRTLARRSLARAAALLAPIRMIVPDTPGSATDAMARLAAQTLGERLGVTVVVENHAGANGAIGSQAVLPAPPDGHTSMGSASIHPMARHVMKNAPHDGR
jgi:tripartite-type tricarboxylate transporter receptor subunit TctC